LRAYIGPEDQGLKEGGQSEGGNMGPGCRPIRSLEAGYREEVGCAQVQISARRPAILKVSFRGFPQSLQVNAGRVP
jgi:hypothetical protein